jgi:MarR family transcriptional regulator, organic hydroperoxide resistance regulator
VTKSAASATAVPALGPTLDFLAVLWELNHSLEATSSRMQAELGVTAQQRMLIRIVGKFPGIAAGQLAALLRIHAGTLSTAIARLEKRGLLQRSRDARDQRRVVLGLTAKGRSFDVPAQGTVESAAGRVLKRLSARDRAATLRCLHAIIDELNANASGASEP